MGWGVHSTPKILKQRAENTKLLTRHISSEGRQAADVKGLIDLGREISCITSSWGGRRVGFKLKEDHRRVTEATERERRWRIAG